MSITVTFLGKKECKRSRQFDCKSKNRSRHFDNFVSKNLRFKLRILRFDMAQLKQVFTVSHCLMLFLIRQGHCLSVLNQLTARLS